MAKRASNGARGQDGVEVESALDDDVVSLNAPITYALTTTDDYRNDTSTTGGVPIGGSSGGTFEMPEDHDWFRITLTAGVPYVLTETAATVPNTFLALYDATGTILTFGHTRLADSVLEFRPTASGTYYLDAGTGSMDSSAVGTYTVSAAVAPAVALTPGTVASPGSGSGNLETAGETDYYAVNLVADHVYEFRASPFGNGRLHLYQVATNVDGAPILSSVASDLTDDHGSGLYYSAAQTGTYYLAASNPLISLGFSIQYFSGTYTVTAAQLDVFDDHAGTSGSAVDVFKAGAGSLSVDGSAAGRLEFQYDQDWYAVTLTAGNTYHLRLDSAGGATGLGRPLLGLFDSSGTLLTEADEGNGGANALIAFVPATSGTYYLAAQSSRAQSKDVGDYIVSVAKTESDQVLDSMATTATLDAGSSTSGRIDTNGEHDWFRIALEAGRTYQFQLNNAGGALGLPKPYLQLRDSSGSMVAEAYGNASITYVALSDSVYFLDAGGLVGFSNPSYVSNNVYFGDYVLSASLGRLIGTPGNDSLTGGPHADTILGLDGDDVLNGEAGADSMYGGTGDDAYAVDGATDQVFEAVGEGNDAVYTLVSYTLMAGQEIEFLGSTSAAGVTLTGNEFANVVVGGAGTDKLNGGGGGDTLFGGGGRDILSGGAGNDIYGVDTAGEKVIEAPGGGIDKVYAFGNFTLASGQEVEYLMAATPTGVTLRGNEFDNFVIGNAGKDTLYGGAGNDHLSGESGSDTVYGGAGDDFILVDSSADRVFEAAGEGTDTVCALASFTLGAGQAIEFLLAATPVGLALTGNALANTLVGNAGGDTLDGGGGADRLVGGAGSDTFLFNTPLGGGTPAAIMDFTQGADGIALAHSVFGAAGAAGTLAAAAFFAGTAAHDADDRIVYDAGTGQLAYDADGNGVGAATVFATVTPGLPLSANDFHIV